jgi:hypothetical protein
VCSDGFLYGNKKNAMERYLDYDDVIIILRLIVFG